MLFRSHPEARARNFSNFSLTGAMTNFAGPLLAGLSIDHLGHATACLVVASQSIIAAVLVLAWGRLLPLGKPQAPVDAGGGRALLNREVWYMLFVSGLVQLGTDLFQFYLPIYGHSIGLSASAIGAWTSHSKFWVHSRATSRIAISRRRGGSAAS